MNDKKLVSPQMEERIIDAVRSKIIPDIKNIFLKIFLVHISVAFVTLSVCPQLGVSSFKTGIDISHFFASFGEMGCDLFCGFFFTSASIAVSLFFLSRDEIRFIKYKKGYLASVFVLVSIGLLLMFNSKLFVELSILWLVGTLFGVISTIEIGAYILKRI